VAADGVTNYGSAFATSNTTSGIRAGVDCSVTPTPEECKCSIDKPCAADSTTLVNSPITAACATCHDSPTGISHMQQMGGTFYGTRAAALATPEKCMVCHGPDTVAAIADVHSR
jgi:hypothetical protein